MTLSEKLTQIKENLERLKEEASLALSLQGVYTEAEDLTSIVESIPERILDIRVYDFNYRFTFKDLDSVGKIHTRNEGLPIGGLDFHPEFVPVRVADKISMKAETLIQPAMSGVYGQVASIEVGCFMKPITTTRMVFKSISTEPEQFIAPIEEEDGE